MNGQPADERTLRTLDFEAIRLRVVSATQTERGRAMAQTMLPEHDFSRVRAEQSATADVRQLVASADFFIARAIDTEALTAAAARGTSLSASDLRAVADACAAAAAACNRARGAESETVREIIAKHRSLKELIAAITDAIDERAAVLDRASPALHRIRRTLVSSQNEARNRVAALLRSPQFANAIQDAVVTIREGRFVVPVKAQFSGEFPGIVHDTSSSGQTLFVEPLAALETNNRLRTLLLEEEHEVARILRSLAERVGAAAATIEANIDALAQLDVLVAKAQLAIAMGAVAPELAEESRVEIRAGRHPLLSDRAVPQSLAFGGEVRLIVISGPNMGGKTVALKMVGLFVTMTYCGLQLPAAEGTVIGCFDRIFADIGDEQSIVENASTFSAHLARMREILERSDARSLILVDEIGGGTEPSAGAALAIAMLERILERNACAVVTTHATELKLFAHQTPGVANASVRFNSDTFAPTYELDVGTPGQSLAFTLARAMGIAPQLIDRAEALMSGKERDYERALADLGTIQARLVAEHAAAAKESAHLVTLQSNARKRAEALEHERRTFARNADERLRQALAEFAAELQRRSEGSARVKVTSAQSELLTRVVEQMHRDLGVTPERSQEASPGAFAEGDRVHVLAYGQDADVIADNGDSLLVAMGAMRTTVSKSEVRRAGLAPKRKVEASGSAALEAATHSTEELDVRGKRFIEAEPLVDRWVDEAVLAGRSPLRLIHGKGTGLLGRGLQAYLKEHPSVKNVRFGNANEGGSGVTVFELR